MQILGKEQIDVLKICSTKYFQERQSLIDGNSQLVGLEQSKLYHYDVFDGKLLYEYLQCSKWNRTNKRFCICSCSQRQGVEDDEHLCQIFTDTNYENLFLKAKRRWEKNTEKDPTYNIDKHRKWCDVKNNGVTELGIDPKIWPISTIRFDVFHMLCAITRRMMSCTREYVLKQDPKIIEKFSTELLGNVWQSSFLVFCWNNNFNFTRFQGTELNQFVQSAPEIVLFLRTNLGKTSKLDDLCDGLVILKRLSKFVRTSYIDDTDEYELQLEAFKQDVKDFYAKGRTTYIEDDETFYFHCMRYYLPPIAEKTYNRHKLGLGIFNMQGFERRNKESKNTMRRFATLNRSSNQFLVNNVKRLLQVFLFDMNAY